MVFFSYTCAGMKVSEVSEHLKLQQYKLSEDDSKYILMGQSQITKFLSSVSVTSTNHLVSNAICVLSNCYYLKFIELTTILLFCHYQENDKSPHTTLSNFLCTK